MLYDKSPILFQHIFKQSDFRSGNYTPTEEYIILPADKPSGYKNTNIKVG